MRDQLIRLQHALSPFLTATMILTVALNVFMPVMAVRGSYPGINGKIVFDSVGEDEETKQIFVMNPNGTNAKQLTYPPIAVDLDEATWSPDGSQIAFTIDGNPFGPTYGGIWVMKLDEPDWHDWIPIYAPPGGTMDWAEPAWSPDGSKVAFTLSVGLQVGVMAAVRDATPTYLTTGQQPHWSPDGTQIVLGRGGNVFVVDANTGTGLRQLTGLTGQAPGGQNFDPCWSPDGSKIVFSSGAGIWVIDATDGTIFAKPTANAYDIQPNWSPDGTKIVFARFWIPEEREYGPSSIWVVNADGTGTPTELTPWGRTITGWGPRHPDWQRLPSAAVGGAAMSASTFALVAPWFVVIGLVGCMGVTTVVARRRR